MLSGSERDQTILVVDDSPAILDMLSSALGLHGYEVISIDGGQEALEWINQNAASGRYPAVILLDLIMAGMDGHEFLKQLRLHWHSHYPLPPVVLLTADQQQHDPEKLGVDYIVTKPFHIHDLLVILQSLLIEDAYEGECVK